MQNLFNKKILLAISGGIAAYKTPDLVRRLREVGSDVQVVMTESAKKFITPLTLQAVSGHPVRDSLWDESAEMAMGHIELARWADAIVIAPASANTLAKLVHGSSDDLLTTLCLATNAPILFAPAMNQQMWQNTATQKNIAVLLERGKKIVGPACGSQACGEVGPGRMVEVDEIVTAVSELFNYGVLQGQHVVITAGPTREAIDPVRFLSNHSTGKMGFALAQAAIEAGANVTLIAGPVNLDTPRGAKRIDVVSAIDMFNVVQAELTQCNIFIGVAAVADYRVENSAVKKIKKTSDSLQLTLMPNPDILAYVGNAIPKPFTVGFCLETDDLLIHAREKLQRKKADMIIANQVSCDTGFGGDENAGWIMTRDSEIELQHAGKDKMAREIIKKIAVRVAHERPTV